MSTAIDDPGDGFSYANFRQEAGVRRPIASQPMGRRLKGRSQVSRNFVCVESCAARPPSLRRAESLLALQYAPQKTGAVDLAVIWHGVGMGRENLGASV